MDSQALSLALLNFHAFQQGSSTVTHSRNSQLASYFCYLMEMEKEKRQKERNHTLFLSPSLSRSFCFLFILTSLHPLVAAVSVSDSWMKLACPTTERNLIQKHPQRKMLNIFRFNANEIETPFSTHQTDRYIELAWAWEIDCRKQCWRE